MLLLLHHLSLRPQLSLVTRTGNSPARMDQFRSRLHFRYSLLDVTSHVSRGSTLPRAPLSTLSARVYRKLSGVSWTAHFKDLHPFTPPPSVPEYALMDANSHYYQPRGCHPNTALVNHSVKSTYRDFDSVSVTQLYLASEPISGDGSTDRLIDRTVTWHSASSPARGSGVYF